MTKEQAIQLIETKQKEKHILLNQLEKIKNEVEYFIDNVETSNKTVEDVENTDRQSREVLMQLYDINTDLLLAYVVLEKNISILAAENAMYEPYIEKLMNK
ncbi:hypothetical protein [Aquimarina algiphila]|uniref:Uncharacterized protein n=1 Tax=Aquimarina algiphila TaxID=2047982 RepID=A0A554VRR9_9FLAO|nr:hypothetical protein [Aquimarina algiphila]TSE11318.1 hypothetical protein FOF46_01425 [Aquimarina algiphila]